MKNLTLMVILLVSTNGISQQIKTNSTLNKTNVVVDTSKTQEISYVTNNRDTLYVVNNMYNVICQLWDKPNYDGVKPVIIPVASITELKNSLIARKEKSPYEKKNKGKAKSQTKSKG